MRKLLLPAILLAMLFMSHVAYAEMLSEKVASDLRDSPVYVDRSIPDSAAKSARLSGRLTTNDQIVVAILPKDAATDPVSFIQELTRLIPDKTVAVAIGQTTTVMAGANWPSQVTVDDLMARAENVALDVTDRMVRFIDAVHKWQDVNPKPVPPKPPAPPTDHTGLYVGLTGGAAAVILLGSSSFVLKRRNTRMRELYGAPRRYRGALKKILVYRDAYGRNTELGEILTQICELSVKYFRCNKKDDAAILHHFLRTNLPAFLQDYRQAQEAEYFQDRDEVLENGRDALVWFREFVRDIVRRDSVINADNLRRNMEILRDARNSTTLP